jgi:hypothetical protein
MPGRVAILCVGPKNLDLKTRLLVLQSEGFAASSCTPEQAPTILEGTSFDVVLLPNYIAQTDKLAIHSAADGETKFLELDAFTYPRDLLQQIRHAIA